MRCPYKSDDGPIWSWEAFNNVCGFRKIDGYDRKQKKYSKIKELISQSMKVYIQVLDLELM